MRHIIFMFALSLIFSTKMNSQNINPADSTKVEEGRHYPLKEGETRYFQSVSAFDYYLLVIPDAKTGYKAADVYTKTEINALFSTGSKASNSDK